MVVDTSALVAILLQEQDSIRYAEAIERAAICLVSAGTALECFAVMQGKKGDEGTRELDRLLLKAAAEIVPFSREHLVAAQQAFRKFGKGRHAAGLNFGDCFGYALAQATGQQLLYKDDDLSKTDVVSAL